MPSEPREELIKTTSVVSDGGGDPLPLRLEGAK